MKSMSGIHAAIPADWRVGDALSVYDVKAGDTFRLLHQAYGIGE
jgi:hypothetical protein